MRSKSAESGTMHRKSIGWAVTALAMSSCLWAGLAAAQQDSIRNAADDAFFLIPERPTRFFVDASSSHIPDAPNLHSTDSVLIDVDNDGDLDAVVSVEYGANRLYINNGSRFVYVPDAFGRIMHDSEHVRAADFNRDGNHDVVFVEETGETHQLYLGDGRGGFLDASDRLPAKSQGNGLAVGDVNGDGLTDIFIGSTGEINHGASLRPAHNILLLNNRARPGHFTDVSSTHLPQGDDQTEGVALADMDADGDLDAVIASPSQPNRLLINDGRGQFTDGSKRLDQSVPTETRDVKILDANGDGRNDIVFFNITSNNRGWEKDPQTRLFVQGADGKFVDESKERLPAHKFSSWAGSVVDFNADGAPDLLVGAIEVPGFVPSQLRAWQNDGQGKFTDVTAQVVPAATVGRSWSMGQGDVDGDGKIDVLIGGWGTQLRLLLTDVAGYFADRPPPPTLPAPIPAKKGT